MRAEIESRKLAREPDLHLCFLNVPGSGLYFLVDAHSTRERLDIEVLAQVAHAALVGRQGHAPLALHSVGAHQNAVGIFPTWIARQYQIRRAELPRTIRFDRAAPAASRVAASI